MVFRVRVFAKDMILVLEVFYTTQALERAQEGTSRMSSIVFR